MTTTATVNVNFTRTREPDGKVTYTFGFHPIQVATLTAGPTGTQYTVTIQLTSNVPDAVLRFLNRDPGSPLPGDLTVSGHDTPTLTLTFTNTGGDHLDYSVTVLAGNMTFQSGDPEIEVPPPNG
jgi:hypothetical protein